MFRYFLHLAYQGTAYRGWQRQPNVNSVQEELEHALGKVLRRKTVCIGCGRTDAEVHAAQYFCNIDVLEPLSSNFVTIINRCLPDDIVIFETILMEGRKHAQFDAEWRTYQYFIHFQKNPFLSNFSYHYQMDALDFSLIEQVLEELPKYSDFRAICKTPDRHDSTACNLQEAKLVISTSQQQLYIEVTANRFVRGMMRLLVGNLIKIGAKRKLADQFFEELSTKKAPAFMEFAPPQGLYLTKVIYPYLERPTSHPVPYFSSSPPQ